MDITDKRAILSRSLAAVTYELRARRAAHSARRRLERELASYSSPAERMELDAMLARHEFAEVAHIHRIVDRHRAA